MREIKFRQRIPMENQVKGWFYWGFIEGGFISPSRLNVPNYQYTGLKDKRGKEIYEGDIVAVGISKKSKDNLNRLVIYDAPTFRLVNKKNEYGNFNLIQDKYNINNAIKLEVIGNIYSNPELLKK